jgi:dolichol-phosphate mannosyltransferase
MAPLDTFVSVVVPLHNDAAVVGPYVRELLAALRADFRDYEVLLIDDGSTDGTAAVLDRLFEELECLRLLRLSRRHGRDVAMHAGLEVAIGDHVVVAEPGADPPDEIRGMVHACLGGAEVVIGVSCGHRRDGLLFHLARRAFYWFGRRLISDRLRPDATHFVAFTRRAVNAVTRIKQRNRHLTTVSCSVGYPTTYFPYTPRAGRRRTTGKGVLGTVQYGISTLVTHSAAPLRLAVYIGVFAGLMNLVYMAYVVAVCLFKDQVAEGWTTLSLQMSGMFFLIFLALVVMAEYLAHILEESKNSPLYQVFDERSSVRPFAVPERRNLTDRSGPDRLAG